MRHINSTITVILLILMLVSCSSSDNDQPEETKVLSSIEIVSSNGNQICSDNGTTILSVNGFDQFNDPISINGVVNWSASNTNVVINEQGNVTAQNDGVSIITASVNNIEATYNITVSNFVNSVSITTGIRKYLVGLDDAFNLSINIDGCTNTNANWMSSDASVATVDSNGLITPTGLGVTQITATVSGVESNTISIEVFPSNGNLPKDISEDIIDFMKNWNIPGASFGIVKDEKLVYLNSLGYKNIVNQDAVTNNTLFRIASVSKTLTSTAIFKLVESNLLSLDDTVFGTDGILNQSIFTNNFPDSRVLDITVRDILYHQAGWDLAIQGDPMFNTINIANTLGVPNPATAENIVDYITQTYTLDFNPGANFKYSNYGYCVLGRVIEKVSGQTYENYVRTAILNPIGATNTQLGSSLLVDNHPLETNYYDIDDATTASVFGTGEQVPWPYGGFNIEAMDAHGGWVSNAKELLKFMTAVDDGSFRPDVITSNSLGQMHTPSPNLSSYAMGWEQIGNDWFHNGSLPGSSALLFNGENGESFAIIFNSWPITQQTQFYNELRPFILNKINSISNWETTDLFD